MSLVVGVYSEKPVCVMEVNTALELLQRVRDVMHRPVSLQVISTHSLSVLTQLRSSLVMFKCVSIVQDSAKILTRPLGY